MNKKISLGVALTIAIMFSTVTFIMTMIYAQNDFNGKVYDLQQREKMYSKLSEVDTRVRKDYYGKIDEGNLSDNIIKGYVAGLNDKYAMYLTAEQHAQASGDIGGKTVDIGITPVQDASGYIKVDKVAVDSPAAASDIQIGDLIIKVDDLSVNAEHYEEAVEKLKGEPGSEVTLTVRRGSVEKNYAITRRRVEVLSADSYVLNEIGVIKITEFNDNTPAQFKSAIETCVAQGAKGLIFDVRSNPGGSMDSVATILDMLLPAGTIVSATDKTGKTEILHVSDSSEIIFPMTVLINGKSASSAELFAQALKDYGKAKLVGTTTLGKGSMQKIFPLNDGSALDITVGLYNPPTSPNFDGVGVKPDYEVKLPHDLEESLSMLDSSADAQLKKAMEVLTAIIKQDEPTDIEGKPSEASSDSTSEKVSQDTDSEKSEVSGK